MSSDQSNAEISSPVIEWRDDALPIAVNFDDSYFSQENGLAETQHVFLTGNDLPARLCDGFHVAELGFGTGLNFLATWAAWRAKSVDGQLKYTSFEAFPMAFVDMERALLSFPELGDLTKDFLELGGGNLETAEIALNIVHGDAQETLPAWENKANAWYLDGFSPAKNPELWNAVIMNDVGNHTAKDGTFATYTAAGHVRRALTEAGFDVERVKGHGRKRHMSRGKLR
ncbi:MAG: tRNA (5-methylaminomethyl-2-thiouridine)(34)-methyltransferase MnmD [Paracoccaceae bacterium]|nr:tRNA (5-methylaminomethyl-2-thiouridine)(34)-methyltransferase MnmD [Paracoccaceae bacterium]